MLGSTGDFKFRCLLCGTGFEEDCIELFVNLQEFWMQFGILNNFIRNTSNSHSFYEITLYNLLIKY